MKGWISFFSIPVILAMNAAVGLATVASDGGGAYRPQSQRCARPGLGSPYVCDVGDPKPLSERAYREVLSVDKTIRQVVARIGKPDRVELQRVDVDSPWLGWELRAYYRDLNRVMAFARAFVLDRPDISVLRYQGPIPVATLVRLEQVVPGVDDALARASDRAEKAAADAEAAADRADQNADRAGGVGDLMDRDFKRTLVKH